MEEADRLADDVAIMNEGSIVARGSPADLKANIGADIITVNVEGEPSEIAKAESAARRQESVEAVQAYDHAIVVYARDGHRAIAGVVLALDEAGIRIGEVTLSRPTLDDVFLQKTGHHIESAEQGRMEGTKENQ
jgi:ABC-2 type transport system ATP-binding protein